VGINVTTTKLSAFGISSTIAGLGGVLLAYRGSLAPESFTVFAALVILALTYLGGIASLSGAMVAGVLVSGGIMTHLSGGTSGSQSDLAFAISGIALVGVAVLYNEGISGAARSGLRRLAALRPGTPTNDRQEAQA
jgi:ABC-type branched-subunit amino acid transport system permease subunit